MTSNVMKILGIVVETFPSKPKMLVALEEQLYSSKISRAIVQNRPTYSNNITKQKIQMSK